MSKNLVGLVIGCLLGMASVSVGQVFEMSTDVVQDGGQEGSGMRIMSFSTNDGFSDTQLFDGPAVMMAPGMDGGFSFGSDPFSLLSNKNVQSELNLVDEQVQQLRDVQKKFSERMREVTAEMRGDGGKFNLDQDMIKKLREVSQEIKEQKKDEMEGLLLPEQLDRLNQVSLQMKMKQQGTVNALGSKEVAEALGLTKEQVEELREKSKEISLEVRKEIEQIREKARKKLLKELTEDQQEKLEALMGDKYEEVEEESPRRRFNFRSGR